MVQYEKVEGNPFARQPRAAAPTATGGAKLTKVDGNPFQRSAGKRKPDLLTKATGFMANVNRGLGIGDEIAGGVTGLFRAGEALGRGRPDQVVNAFQSGMRDQRAREDAFQASNPTMAALGRGVGNAATVAVPVGQGANALLAGSRGVNMARGAVSAGLTGAAYAAADRGTAGERLRAASETARNPVVLGLGAAGGALSPVARKAPKPAKIAQEVVDLRARGVPLTPGQMRGGVYKAAEDAGTSLPILGTSIQEAREAGVEGFNRAAANEALKPVGKTLPDNIRPGYEAVAYVKKQLGGMYDDVIPTAAIKVDADAKAAIGSRVAEISQDMTEAGRNRLAQILDQRVARRVDENGGVLTGELYQRINSELNTVGGRFAKSSDADQQAIAEAIEAVRDELRNAAARQDPSFAARKTAIDKGYALYKRMEAAAASPGAEAGVFTPKGYGGAVRRSARTQGQIATGGALGQDLANAGRAVLPSAIPDSGTATRGVIASAAAAPGAMIAAGITGGPAGVASVAGGYAAGAATLKGLSRLYTPEAIQLANLALDERITRQQSQQALEALRQIAIRNPQVRELHQRVAAQLSRAVAAPVATQPRPASSGGQ